MARWWLLGEGRAARHEFGASSHRGVRRGRAHHHTQADYARSLHAALHFQRRLFYLSTYLLKVHAHCPCSRPVFTWAQARLPVSAGRENTSSVSRASVNTVRLHRYSIHSAREYGPCVCVEDLHSPSHSAYASTSTTPPTTARTAASRPTRLATTTASPSSTVTRPECR